MAAQSAEVIAGTTEQLVLTVVDTAAVVPAEANVAADQSSAIAALLATDFAAGTGPALHEVSAVSAPAALVEAASAPADAPAPSAEVSAVSAPTALVEAASEVAADQSPPAVAAETNQPGSRTALGNLMSGIADQNEFAAKSEQEFTQWLDQQLKEFTQKKSQLIKAYLNTQWQLMQLNNPVMPKNIGKKQLLQPEFAGGHLLAAAEKELEAKNKTATKELDRLKKEAKLKQEQEKKAAKQQQQSAADQTLDANMLTLFFSQVTPQRASMQEKKSKEGLLLLKLLDFLSTLGRCAGKSEAIISVMIQHAQATIAMLKEEETSKYLLKIDEHSALLKQLQTTYCSLEDSLEPIVQALAAAGEEKSLELSDPAQDDDGAGSAAGMTPLLAVARRRARPILQQALRQYQQELLQIKLARLLSALGRGQNLAEPLLQQLLQFANNQLVGMSDPILAKLLAKVSSDLTTLDNLQKAYFTFQHSLIERRA